MMHHTLTVAACMSGAPRAPIRHNLKKDLIAQVFLHRMTTIDQSTTASAITPSIACTGCNERDESSTIVKQLYWLICEVNT